jgi:LuxR family transcriptional regulator, maltose regulon positive regulatory protein
MESGSSSAAGKLLRRGEEALLRGAWREARESFEAVLAEADSPEALIGAGVAARYQFDAAGALGAHESAFRLARERGDARLAGGAALELVFDCGLFRGPAEMGGWLERAARLLDGTPPGYERGVLTYLRARYALEQQHDPGAAGRLAREGVELARLGSAFDGEMVCLALEGLAMVADGRVGEGMRRLDEATTAAVSGEIRDARSVEVVCCHLIDACQRVRDFDRAGEWCRRVEEIAQRFDDAEMFATCRTLYGEVLTWQGAWGEAERTLSAVCREFAHVPGKAVDGLVRLAELRRRQGRLEDAAALLAEVGEHRVGSVTRAALALDRGDASGALAECERFLRGVGDRDRLERVRALELLVRAHLALQDRACAESAVGELEEIAAGVGTKPLRAASLLARGRAELGRDAEAACVALQDAVDLFGESGVRYEAAHAKLELAGAFRELGREAAAASAEDSGRAELAKLGIATPAPSMRVVSRRRGDGGLTGRERQVLRLIAEGRSNDEIAAELVLSVRTVEHHVASIYTKIGASGRTARAAAAAYALSNGLV